MAIKELNHCNVKDLNEVQELIKELVKHTPIERIYLYQQQKEHCMSNEMLILISNKFGQSLNELMPVVDVAFSQYKQINYRLFHVHQVKDAMKQGCLFFHMACTNQHQVYRGDDAIDELYPDQVTFEKILEKAKTSFTKEMAKINTFKEGAAFYLSKENYGQTAFMLHQVIELCYRAVEFFVMGNDKRTHSIKLHQKYLAYYVPLLASLFAEEGTENNLLNILDEAYLAVRYKNDFEVSLEQVNVFFEKADQVQAMAEELYHIMLSNFEKLHQPAERTIPIINFECPGTAGANMPVEIIEMLNKAITIIKLYCFGYRTYHKTCLRQSYLIDEAKEEENDLHYDILVLTNEDHPDLIALQDRCSKINHYNITLIVHHINEAINKKDKNRHFFSSIIKQSEQICPPKQELFKNTDVEEHIGLSPAEGFNHFYRFQKNSLVLLETANLMIKELNSELALSMLHQSMEQLCLGMIYVFMAYQPNQYTLSHLFNLCRNFSPIIDEVFPLYSPVEKELLNLIGQFNRNLPKHIELPDSIHAQVTLLANKCSLLYIKVSKACEDRLQRIEAY